MISGLILRGSVCQMVLKFDVGMDMDDLAVDPVGQGQRSRSPGQKTWFQASGKWLFGFTMWMKVGSF